jgi:hypothetical protein
MMEGIKAVTLQVAAAVGQYRFVKVTTAAKVIQTAAAGDDTVGIALEARTAGNITDGNDQIPVALPGCKCFVVAGAAIDVSAGVVPVCSDGTGRAIAVSAATDRVLGYALSSAGAANEMVTVLFIKAADRRDA